MSYGFSVSNDGAAPPRRVGYEGADGDLWVEALVLARGRVA